MVLVGFQQILQEFLVKRWKVFGTQNQCHVLINPTSFLTSDRNYSWVSVFRAILTSPS